MRPQRGPARRSHCHRRSPPPGYPEMRQEWFRYHRVPALQDIESYEEASLQPQLFQNFIHETSAELLTFAMHWQDGNPISQTYNRMPALPGTEPASFGFEEAFELGATHRSNRQHQCSYTTFLLTLPAPLLYHEWRTNATSERGHRQNMRHLT